MPFLRCRKKSVVRAELDERAVNLVQMLHVGVIFAIPEIIWLSRNYLPMAFYYIWSHNITIYILPESTEIIALNCVKIPLWIFTEKICLHFHWITSPNIVDDSFPKKRRFTLKKIPFHTQQISEETTAKKIGKAKQEKKLTIIFHLNAYFINF